MASAADRCQAAALFIFVVGVTCGAAIYFTAEEESLNAGMELMLSSKQYYREVERFGGKAMKLFVDFDQWFRALWHGKAHGSTIATLSALASLGLYLIGKKLR